jgi:hypothetical protein
MTRVRITWTETAQYSQVFEVEDFDPKPDADTAPLEQAILQDADWGNVTVVERDITDWKEEE